MRLLLNRCEEQRKDEPAIVSSKAQNDIMVQKKGTNVWIIAGISVFFERLRAARDLERYALRVRAGK